MDEQDPDEQQDDDVSVAPALELPTAAFRVKAVKISGEVAEEVRVSPTQLVSELRRVLARTVGSPPRFLRLVAGSRVLDPVQTVVEAGLCEGSVVQVVRILVPQSEASLFRIDEDDPLIVSCLVEGRADPNETGLQHQTPLHDALARGFRHVSEAILALEGFTQVNVADCFGQTVLHKAADAVLEGPCEVVLSRTDFRQVGRVDEGRRTALHLAAGRGSRQICAAILRCEGFRAVAAADGHGRTALHRAAEMGHLEICRMILTTSGSALASVRDRWGRTALHWAAAEGHDDVCRFLALDCLSAQDVACADHDGKMALHWAAANGHPSSCEVILQRHAGAALGQVDRDGCSALDLACTAKHSEVQKILGRHIEAVAVSASSTPACSQVAAPGREGLPMRARRVLGRYIRCFPCSVM